jgi:clan AA aspartic protease (TIGR02281 family)
LERTVFDLDRQRNVPHILQDSDDGGLLWKTLAILAVGCAAVVSFFVFQEKTAPHYDFSKLYARFSISPLPAEVLNADLLQDLNRLSRDPCDNVKIFSVGRRLIAEGERRLAADFYLGASHACGDDQYSEREAAGLYNAVKDYPKAYALFADLTGRFPQNNLDWYNRGKVEAAMKRTDDALASYQRAIDLSGNKANLGSWVFEEMAALYAAEGRFCEALSPIETYISLGGAEQANDRASRIIDDYAEKGHCDQRAASSESFPVLSSGVVNVRATINGVTGIFAVDTGATFVSLNEAFADHANLATVGFVETQTANGKATVRRALAAMIRLGSLKAEDVPVVILDRPLAGVDGLLGRSFLSRFEMVFGRHQLTLTTKAPS